MASLIPGYEYDIFISYRQKDNKYDGWVTEFIDNLMKELEATFKEEISVYFDINPHDGLLETHDVDASLKDKLKCLVFIPIVSRTYCDPKSFAWEHEFKAFVEQASKDQFGLKVKLPNGNVATRILPIQIHDLNSDDKVLVEKELGGFLRSIEFIYKESGVNRPLKPDDDDKINLTKTKYRNQINKVANAVDEIIYSLKNFQAAPAIEKTLYKEPLVEIKKEESKQEQEKSATLSRRKLLSGIAILAILITSIVLAYPKIFKSRDNLQTMTMTVSVVNEFGKKETRKVLKENYITKLSIFPFTNERSDSSRNWLQYGISYALSEDLLQFNYMSIGWNSDVSHIQEQINDAKNNNYPYFLTGVFKITDGIYEITSKLYQTTNGAIIAERVFKGSDFFSLIDTVSLQTRIDLGISKGILNSTTDLPINEQMTYNLDAFQFFIEGTYNIQLEKSSSLISLNKAIELDSTFALASYSRANIIHTFEYSYESECIDINQAMRHRQRLSEYREISTRILYYAIFGEDDKSVTLAEMQYKLHPYNIELLYELAHVYFENFMVQECENAVLELNKLMPDSPDYRINLAHCYLYSGKLDKGLKVLEKLLKGNPENANALQEMGTIYLHKNDLDAAELFFKKAILLNPEDEKYWSKIFDHIDYVRKNPVKIDFLEPYTGNYRYEGGIMTLSVFVYNNHLIIKAKNQLPNLLYQVSDTEFISREGFFKETFLKDKQGKVIKIIHKQRNVAQSRMLWKEDSIIIKARDLLLKSKQVEALSAFRIAYNQNPEYYYLALFIKHLEFILNPEYSEIKPTLESFTGKYGQWKIYNKNSEFFITSSNGLIRKILPLSDSLFMYADKFDQIQIVKENKSIKGLKFIFSDGSKEQFFSRNN
jgi:tetratricopeptide (TPR) repeat protein